MTTMCQCFLLNWQIILTDKKLTEKEYTYPAPVGPLVVVVLVLLVVLLFGALYIFCIGVVGQL